MHQHTSRYLALVKAGGRVEVTERGRLIALLVGPSPTSTVRERLLERSSLLPASQPFTLRGRRALPDGGTAATKALEELHSERHR
ncbi:MAG: type II toxin-antitoxin system prevent-host-death family antitoxin [Candidatus Dormiibacterota bacterium]